MKNIISRLRSDRILLRSFLLSILLEILTVSYALLNYNNLPPLVPIFNQLPWGDQRFMTTAGIFIPAIIFMFIFVSNLIIATLVYSKNPLISRIIAATTLLISVMNFIFIVRTILVIL